MNDVNTPCCPENCCRGMNEEVQCVIFRRMYEQAAPRIPIMQISSGCPVTKLVRVLILFVMPVLVSAQTSNHSIVYQGVQRNYIVFLPRTCAISESIPLTLILSVPFNAEALCISSSALKALAL